VEVHDLKKKEKKKEKRKRKPVSCPSSATLPPLSSTNKINIFLKK